MAERSDFYEDRIFKI